MIDLNDVVAEQNRLSRIRNHDALRELSSRLNRTIKDSLNGPDEDSSESSPK
jgi:uncharacterized coiled-coil protein SlyX